LRSKTSLDLFDFYVGAFLLGNGDGTLQAPVLIEQPLEIPYAPFIAVASFNNDGRLDVAYAAETATSTYYLSVAVHAVGSTASLLPPYLSFPTQSVAIPSSPLPIVLINAGNAPLSIASYSFTGTNPADFSESNNCPIAPGLSL
jgi:hypothetical protein